jgi:drug/metabolite transporter (DMT)-like permease
MSFGKNILTDAAKVHERRPIPPLLGLAIGVMASSTASIFIRFAQVSVGSLVIAAYRLGIATLVLLVILTFRKDASLTEIRGRSLRLAFGAGVLLAVHFATWVSSLEYTTVASSVVLVSTAPLFVALLTPIFLKEAVAPSLRYAIALSILGTLLVAMSDSCLSADKFQCPPIEKFLNGPALKGDLLALGGAISGAGYMLIGRKLRGKISLLPYISVVYGIAALVLVLLAAIAGQKAIGFPPSMYLWFALLAIFPQLVGHSSINWALRFLTAVYVSITLLGEPIGSTLLAFFIFREQPTWLMLVGSVLILSGIVSASLRSQQDKSMIEVKATSGENP